MFASFAAVMLTFPANSATVWNWDYSGTGITASGTFTTVDSPDANGGYLILGISGTRDGDTITGLQAPGTSIPGNEPYVVDDLVFLGPGPQLTSGGFGFSSAGGSFSNPFYAGFLPTPGYLDFFSTPPTFSETAVVFAATPVATPEPATLALVFMAAVLLWPICLAMDAHSR